MDKSAKIRICFMADKHGLFDDRIYWKMAVPLANLGYEVYYLLIDNEADEGVTAEGIHYEKLKIKTPSTYRYANFILKQFDRQNNHKKLLQKAASINADIYHFHDLWINKIGRKLKNLKHNPVVFYDAREPYAEDYLTFFKSRWVIGNLGLKIFSNWIEYWEKKQAKHYDLIISNEDYVRDKFRKKLGPSKAETLYNFTDNYVEYRNLAKTEKKYDIIYCGGITASRGALKILEAVKLIKQDIPEIQMLFLGRYSPIELKSELKSFIKENHLSQNVILHDFVDYRKIGDFYNQSKIGIITWLPEQSLKIKLPIKIFEYMAFGLPIIGSNFGHIKKYIDLVQCGISVNPYEEKEIANGIITMLNNEKKYDRYRNNGREATLANYRWEIELERLIKFYNNALDARAKD